VYYVPTRIPHTGTEDLLAARRQDETIHLRRAREGAHTPGFTSEQSLFGRMQSRTAAAGRRARAHCAFFDANGEWELASKDGETACEHKRGGRGTHFLVRLELLDGGRELFDEWPARACAREWVPLAGVVCARPLFSGVSRSNAHSTGGQRVGAVAAWRESTTRRARVHQCTPSENMLVRDLPSELTGP
jgi:hypothetical protein